MQRKRGHKKNALRLVAAALLVALAVVGCTPAQTEKNTADRGEEAAASVRVEVIEMPNSALAPDSGNGVVDGQTEQPSSRHYEVGLFSWEESRLNGTRRAKLYMAIHALGITELYQSFDGADLSDEGVSDFVHDLSLMGVRCYYLTGDRWWGTDPDGKEMIARVEAVAAYNEAHPNAPFTGVCFDVETFLVDEWSEDPDTVMELQVGAHKAAYAAAKAAGLRMIACLPVWYDEQGQSDGFEAILRNGCDEIALMNYGRNSEYKRIAYEVDCAKRLNKPITCIFEFQRPGMHELKENETYFNIGIDRAVANFEALYDAFGYDQFKFAYHYLLPLLELMDA